jgi:hypothetical protein
MFEIVKYFEYNNKKIQMGNETSTTQQIQPVLNSNEDETSLPPINLDRVEIPCMFFSWVSYAESSYKISDWLVGQKFSATEGYSRLEGFSEWIVTSEFLRDERLEHIHALVCHSDERKQAIVAFRGTELNITERWEQTLNDWVYGCFDSALIEWNKEETKCGRVHAGFLKHYKSIAEQVQSQLVSYFENGFTVIFTGHSQGGALATLAVTDAIQRNLQYKYQAHLITFGAPNIGDQEYVNYFKCLIRPSQVTHYITSYPYPFDARDIVTTVPPESWGYRQVNGTKKFISASKKHFGNPNPIKNVEYQGPRKVLRPIGCHYQQTYMDGLLYNEISDTPFVITVMAKMKLKQQETYDNWKDMQNMLNTNTRSMKDTFKDWKSKYTPK